MDEINGALLVTGLTFGGLTPAYLLICYWIFLWVAKPTKEEKAKITSYLMVTITVLVLTGILFMGKAVP